jgi:FkbM family methyltransferase
MKIIRREVMSVRPYMRGYYSQEGEDIILSRIFSHQDVGFFVDVGAHHPWRFSNTYWAYKRGWSGINIDASPDSMRRFDRFRPRDRNIERYVGESESSLDFFVFDEPALNTSDVNRNSALVSSGSFRSKKVKVKPESLASILSHISQGTKMVIDFMSVDVEGAELQVLQSNDWEKYAPRVLVVEVLGRTLSTITDFETIQYLSELGYVPVSMLYHSVIMVKDPELLQRHWSENS